MAARYRFVRDERKDGMTRARDSKKIRHDALRMAHTKLREGCEGCVAGYLALARQHGATDEEVESVLSRTGDLSRRELLIKAVAASCALVVGSVLPTAALADSNRAAGITPLQGDQLHPLFGTAMRNTDVHLLHSYIEQHGFRLSMPHSRGAVRPDGSEMLTLVFKANDRSKDHALIAWARTATGTERVQGDIIHYLQDSGPISSLQAASLFIKTTGLSVVNGQIVVVDDYWSCFWKALVGCCGPGAIACLWAGPAWLECVYAVCGFCVYYSMWTCY